MIDAKEVGKRLKRIRYAVGLSRPEMADKVGIGEKPLVLYEHGTALPVAVALKVTDCMPGMTLDWIYAGRDAGLPADLRFNLAGDDDADLPTYNVVRAKSAEPVIANIITSVYSFPNGQTMVFDQHGQQMPHFQGNTEEMVSKIRQAGFRGVIEQREWPKIPETSDLWPQSE
jgi:transcriptional regulator with XRE-family HTH domain